MAIKRGRLSVLSCTAIFSVCGLAWSARADLPSALDRVPADALVAVSMKNISTLHSQFGKLKDATGLPADLGMVEQLINTPGLNKSGSAALVLMPGPAKAADANPTDDDDHDSADEGPMVLIVPVSDYAAFIKNFGGSGDDKIASLTMPDEMELAGSSQVFAKDLGGGYAAMGPVKTVIESFDGAGGKAGDHKQRLGPVGQRVADANETFVLANIEKLAPKIEETMAGMKEGMGMAIAMAGPQAAQMERSMLVMESIAKAVVRDATVAVAGLGFDEKGVTFDLAAQFREGSPSFKLFQSKGKSSALLSKIPSSKFLFAYAADLSGSGTKQLIKEAGELAKAQADNAAGDVPAGFVEQMVSNLEKTDGIAMYMGETPGLMAGGMMANSYVYFATKNTDELAKSFKTSTEALNGKTVQGLTFTTAYKPAALEVAGIKVDEWETKMAADPNGEMAMQMQQLQMMQNMIWGASGGPSGYVAKLDGGVIQTLSKNQVLLTTAINASNGKAGETDPLLKEVSSHLPADRTFEAYIGTKSVLDTVVGFLSMMGGGPGIQVPDQVSPVGLGGTTDAGGVQIRTYVPASVIKTAYGLSSAMNGPQDDDDAPADESGKPPRF